LTINNRVINNNINNINVQAWNQHNANWKVNRNWWHRPGNWNRPAWAGRPAWYWGRPWYRYHYTWHHGYWRWPTYPAIWLGAGMATGVLLSPGDTFVYANPYYVQPVSTTVVVPQYLNYSAPIASPDTDQLALAYPPEPPEEEAATSPDGAPAGTGTAPPPPETEDPEVAAANQLFERARAAFKSGEYVDAQRLVEQAIAQLPSDATLHEFRALTLFAQGKYQNAAAALYAVLANGPGWGWDTMRSLYGDVETYTRQLRALEEYVRQNPAAADAHFVLAYQYLVTGATDAAVRQLHEVVRLQPKDKLSATLLTALTQAPGTGSETNTAPPAINGSSK
jgi:hypothetical protein